MSLPGSQSQRSLAFSGAGFGVYRVFMGFIGFLYKV